MFFHDISNSYHLKEKLLKWRSNDKSSLRSCAATFSYFVYVEFVLDVMYRPTGLYA